MPLRKNILFCCALTWLFVGCTATTTTPDTAQAEANAYSAVSSRSADFKPVKGATFAWYGEPVWADGELEQTRPGMGLELQRSVSQQLIKRGYTMVSDRAVADYLIGIGILTEGGTRSDEIADFFRVFPQLVQSEAGYAKGTIVAGVIAGHGLKRSAAPPDRKSLLWRSGVEAYILDLGYGTAASRERINGLTGVLMGTLP